MVIAVFLPRVRHDYWVFRVLEYPRLQKLGLIAAILIIWPFFISLHDPAGWLTYGLLFVSACYLAYKVYPYTPLCRKEMKTASPGERSETLKIFTANVLQDNREYHRLLAQVQQEDPDIVFLVETDHQWRQAMKDLRARYPFSLEHPQGNTYGLLFYSRIPVADARVRFLVKADIPSIEATLRWPARQTLKIWGLHPEPPVPGESLYATAKDKELMKVALSVKACPDPCIVFGDLNDVAWSHTTELFRKTSRLLDPRIGRGFYATFSAHTPWVRFPLDYIFCSDHFRLAAMKRLPPNGSDHFATVVTLAFVPEKKDGQQAPAADGQELEQAQMKASSAVPDQG